MLNQLSDNSIIDNISNKLTIFLDIKDAVLESDYYQFLGIL